MTADLSAARIYTDFQGLSDLRRAAKNNSEAALGEVAGQFEAVFIQMMLKSMRDASLAEGMFDSQQSEMYLGMFDQQVALDLSAKGAFGIAGMLVQQLGHRQDMGTGPASPSLAPLSARTQWPVTETASADPRSPGLPEFDSPGDFIARMRPLAAPAAARLGVNPQVLIAQAALETGWGKKIIARPDGSSSFNLFGIKADRGWSGDESTVSTLEYRDGVLSREAASFRAYASFQESFDDYVAFVQQGPRYQAALGQASGSRDYIRGLQVAGYATDPFYAEKVLEIMARDFNAGQELKQDDHQ